MNHIQDCRINTECATTTEISKIRELLRYYGENMLTVPNYLPGTTYFKSCSGKWYSADVSSNITVKEFIEKFSPKLVDETVNELTVKPKSNKAPTMLISSNDLHTLMYWAKIGVSGKNTDSYTSEFPNREHPYDKIHRIQTKIFKSKD